MPEFPSVEVYKNPEEGEREMDEEWEEEKEEEETVWRWGAIRITRA